MKTKQSYIKLALINNSLLVPKPTKQIIEEPSMIDVLSIASNLLRYGYTVNLDTMNSMYSVERKELVDWWKNTKPVLADISLVNKRIQDGLVCVNFPQKHLSQENALQIQEQMLAYSGQYPEKTERITVEPVIKNSKCLNGIKSIDPLIQGILSEKSIWTQDKKDIVIDYYKDNNFDLDLILFNDNKIQFMSENIKTIPFYTVNPSNIIRLAQYWNKDYPMVKINSKQRKILCRLVGCMKIVKLKENLPRNEKDWKWLFKLLHFQSTMPYKEKHCKLVDDFHKGKIKSTASIIINGIETKDKKCFGTLKKYPGEFYRRFAHVYSAFKTKAVDEFIKVLPKLDTEQLVSMKALVLNYNNMGERIVTPKATWAKAKVVEKSLVTFEEKDVDKLVKALDNMLHKNLKQKLPNGVKLDEKLKQVKLHTHQNIDVPYGRGTKIDIPDNVNIIRLMSHWKETSSNTVWYDVGANMYDDQFNQVNVLSWNHSNVPGCKFSGDPTSGSSDGIGTQVFDINLNEIESNTRYIMWNILCYSHTSFIENEVYGNVQYLKDENEGDVYDPSRSDLKFQIKSENMTEMVALVDTKEKQLILLDVALPGSVSSCCENDWSKELKSLMSYLDTKPSVYDLLESSVSDSEKATTFAYTDIEKVISDNAYVFNPVNQDSVYEPIVLNDLLIK